MKPGRRQIHLLYIGLTVAILAIWVKAYWLIAASIPVALLIGHTPSYQYLKKRAQQWPKWVRHSMEWSIAGAYAWGIGYLIQSCFVSINAISSSAMLPDVPMQSVWIVDKMSCGAALHADDPQQYTRTHALRKFMRNDPVVVRKPGFVVRSLAQEAPETDLSNPDDSSDSQFQDLLLRIIGLPGDSIRIHNGSILIRNQPHGEVQQVSNEFVLRKSTSTSKRRQMVQQALKVYSRDELTRIKLRLSEVKQLEWTDFLDPLLDAQNYPDPQIFPHQKTLLWNKTFMGPLYLPKKGDEIRLTPANLLVYRPLIEQYEKVNLEMKDNQVSIDGTLQDTYTFKMNYYWTLGDNRANSFDSRYFGPIPENHLIGIAALRLQK